MKFTFITLFPNIIEIYTSSSIFGRSCEKKIINVETINIRDFAQDKHKTCDDTPYGGGYGMVLLPQPLHDALCSVKTDVSHVVFPTPSGPLFEQKHAYELAQKEEIIFICGRYEGIDQRIIDLHVHDVFSVGDYVLSSGELAALTIADATHRLVDGVINNGSLEEESYVNGLLEYPHYTKPAVFQNMPVPDVLLSGNHKKIQEWRYQAQCEKTKQHRPDLYEEYKKKYNK